MERVVAIVRRSPAANPIDNWQEHYVSAIYGIQPHDRLTRASINKRRRHAKKHGRRA
jgi:hypothetical protein